MILTMKCPLIGYFPQSRLQIMPTGELALVEIYKVRVKALVSANLY